MPSPRPQSGKGEPGLGTPGLGCRDTDLGTFPQVNAHRPGTTQGDPSLQEEVEGACPGGLALGPVLG